MRNKKPKTVNSLMKYLRDNKNINISGSKEKRMLMNMGYYHGYKGYRFFTSSNNKANYKSFFELESVYNFDSKLKSLFYPYVMLIETAFKNYALEVINDSINSDDFVDVYNDILDNCKYYKSKNKKDEAIKLRLRLRTVINNIQFLAYSNRNPIALHYFSKDLNIPIWGLFELMSLGDFGSLVKCMNPKCRIHYAKLLDFESSNIETKDIIVPIIFALKELRNSIAHNGVIFDTRFKKININKSVCRYIKDKTKTEEIDFTTITDYLVLIALLLKSFDISRSRIISLIDDYKKYCEDLKTIGKDRYYQILHTDYLNKLDRLITYVKQE